VLTTPVPPGGVATLVLRVRLPVPIDTATLLAVERSFEAKGKRDVLQALRGRLLQVQGNAK